MLANVSDDADTFLTKLDFKGKYRGGLSPLQVTSLRALIDSHNDLAARAICLPTGVGKTAIGLLYARWALENGEQVAYLCQNKALVDQAIDEAALLGVPANPVHGRMHYPSYEEYELAVEPYNDMDIVGVFSYSSYMKGSQTESASVLVVDDAHQLRQQVSRFTTLQIPNESPCEPLYAEIEAMLSDGGAFLGDYALRHRNQALDYKEQFSIVPFPLVWEKRASIGHAIDDFCKAFNASSSKPDIWFQWRSIGMNFTRFVCCMSPDSIIFRPFVQSIDFMRRKSGEKIFPPEARMVLMTATMGPPALFAELCGITREIKIVSKDPHEPVHEYTGHRAVAPLRDAGGIGGINSAVTNTIQRLMGRYKRAILFVQSGRQSAEIASRLGDTVTVRRYTSPEDLKNFLADDVAHLPSVLTLVNREGGIDIADRRCRVAIHVELPIVMDAFEYLRNSILEDEEFAALVLAQRMTQSFGRLNRNADNQSVHFVIDERLLAQLNNPHFYKFMDFNAYADAELGRREVRRLGFEDFLDLTSNFINGSGPLVDAEQLQGHRDRLSKKRAKAKKEKRRFTRETIEAWTEAIGGSHHNAATKFEKLAAKLQDVDHRSDRAFVLYCQAHAHFLANPEDANHRRETERILEQAIEVSPPGIPFFSCLGQIRAFLETGERVGPTAIEWKNYQARRIRSAVSLLREEAALELGDESVSPPALSKVLGSLFDSMLLNTDHDVSADGVSKVLTILGFEVVKRELHGVDVFGGARDVDGTFSLAIEVKVDAQGSGKPTSSLETNAPKQAFNKAAGLSVVSQYVQYLPAKPAIWTNRPKAEEAVISAAKDYGVPLVRRHCIEGLGEALGQYAAATFEASRLNFHAAREHLLYPRQFTELLMQAPSIDVGAAIIRKTLEDRTEKLVGIAGL